MKKLLVVLILSCCFASCTNAQVLNPEKETVIIPIEEEIKNEIDSSKCGLSFSPNNNYSKTKVEIKELRNKLSIKYKTLNDSTKLTLINIAKPIFTNQLLNKIIPYWYGTEWDFNGYTAKPNVGKIACGYFVSTTLRDMGLNLNRYDLAKKGPEDEANSIAITKEYTTIINEDEIEERLFSLKDGLYFVGLDGHVGYLYKYDSLTYFIHSNYIENKVMVELTSNSEAFGSSMYYLTDISDNDLLIKKWLTNRAVKIVEK